MKDALAYPTLVEEVRTFSLIIFSLNCKMGKPLQEAATEFAQSDSH